MRSLQVDYLSCWSVQDEVYSEIAKKRPHLTLLPKLKRLKIVPKTGLNLVHSLLFFGRNVRELEFRWAPQFSPPDSDQVSDFFDECAVRMPNLKKFSLHGFDVDYTTQLQPDIVKLVPSMSGLETFSCSLYYATSATFVALSQLPSLRVITFDYPTKCGIGNAIDVIDLRPTFNPESFPSLVDLSFSATFEDAASLLEMDIAPNLEILFIHSPMLETAAQLQHLLKRLATNRRGLTQLCLSSISPMSDASNHKEMYHVSFETLEPLLDFMSLVDFQIAYHCPFQLNNAELGTLVRDWSHLEVLHLCSDPFLRLKSTLTPAVLPIIAERCPKLRALSLYIDTHIEGPRPPVTDLLDPTRFTSLERIEFGTSALQAADITSFCLFLGDLLPVSCNIETLCGVSWLLKNELFNAGFGIESEVVIGWKQVSSMLKMLIMAREHERSRVRELVSEARDLRMRVAMLENQLQLGYEVITERQGVAGACAHQ